MQKNPSEDEVFLKKVFNFKTVYKIKLFAKRLYFILQTILVSVVAIIIPNAKAEASSNV